MLGQNRLWGINRVLQRSTRQSGSLNYVPTSTESGPSNAKELQKATRSEISAQCLRGRVPKAQIDAAIEHLLTATPPTICVEFLHRTSEATGTVTRIYRSL